MMNRLRQKSILINEHGKANPLISTEENAMIHAVDQALSTTRRPSTIGKNGETPLLEFLQKYLPYTFHAVSGYFITPNGRLSPRIDILIVDARYPYLAENVDGSVMVMLHSVVQTISVKTRLISSDIETAWKEAFEMMQLASEVGNFKGDQSGAVSNYVLAYRTTHRLDTLHKTFASLGEPTRAGLDISILRLAKKDQINSSDVGVELHYEPVNKVDQCDGATGYMPTSRVSYSMLSDIYYNLVQTGYATLACRDFGFSDISHHLSQYMAWTGCPWDEFFRQVPSHQRQ